MFINLMMLFRNRAMLINAIAVEGNSYRVRFCDLAPRAAGNQFIHVIEMNPIQCLYFKV